MDLLNYLPKDDLVSSGLKLVAWWNNESVFAKGSRCIKAVTHMCGPDDFIEFTIQYVNHSNSFDALGSFRYIHQKFGLYATNFRFNRPDEITWIFCKD